MTSLKYSFIVHMLIHLPKNDISKCNRDTIRPRLFHKHESKFTPCCPTNARNIPRFKAGDTLLSNQRSSLRLVKAPNYLIELPRPSSVFQHAVLTSWGSSSELYQRAPSAHTRTQLQSLVRPASNDHFKCSVYLFRVTLEFLSFIFMKINQLNTTFAFQFSLK